MRRWCVGKAQACWRKPATQDELGGHDLWLPNTPPPSPPTIPPKRTEYSWHWHWATVTKAHQECTSAVTTAHQEWVRQQSPQITKSEYVSSCHSSPRLSTSAVTTTHQDWVRRQSPLLTSSEYVSSHHSSPRLSTSAITTTHQDWVRQQSPQLILWLHTDGTSWMGAVQTSSVWEAKRRKNAAKYLMLTVFLWIRLQSEEFNNNE